MDRAGILRFPGAPAPMVSRWRRRVACTVIADEPRPAALLSVSARVAIVDLDDVPPGRRVTLLHPVAGAIEATAGIRTGHGLHLYLAGDAQATGFALVATAADMTRGG